VAYGTARTPEAATLPDLNKRELGMLTSIALVVLWMGIYPESFLAPMRNDVGVLLARIERAAPPGDAQLVRGNGVAPGAGHAAGAAGQGAAAHETAAGAH
jgi:NADH-quinone oxidoreductase subunit M